jgi:hypothetical protein
MPKPKPEKNVSRRDSSRRYLYPLLIVLLLSTMAAIWFYLQATTPRLPLASPVVAAKPLIIPGATLVDEQQCQGCHQAQVQDWQGSHHQLAMQPATPQTVPADFNNTSFSAEG